MTKLSEQDRSTIDKFTRDARSRVGLDNAALKSFVGAIRQGDPARLIKALTYHGHSNGRMASLLINAYGMSTAVAMLEPYAVWLDERGAMESIPLEKVDGHYPASLMVYVGDIHRGAVSFDDPLRAIQRATIPIRHHALSLLEFPSDAMLKGSSRALAALGRWLDGEGSLAAFVNAASWVCASAQDGSPLDVALVEAVGEVRPHILIDKLASAYVQRGEEERDIATILGDLTRQIHCNLLEQAWRRYDPTHT